MSDEMTPMQKVDFSPLIHKAKQNAAEAEKLLASQTPQQAETAGQTAERNARILALHNFPAENLRPDIAKVSPQFRKPIDDYCKAIATMIDAHHGVFFSGGLGSGKTSCMALIALAAHNADIPVVYIRSGQDVAYACDMVDAKQRAYSMSFQAAAEDVTTRKIWPHSEAKILLIDDLDYVDNDAAMQTVGRYLYNAYANGQCVCVACNISWRDLVMHRPLQRVADRWERHIPPQYRLLSAESSRRGGAQ